MKFQQVAAAVALAGVAAAAPTAEEHTIFRRQWPVLECSHLTGGLHVIAVGGANSPDPKVYGLLGTLALGIVNALPGSTNVSVPYDKVFATTVPTNKLDPAAIPAGMQTLKNYINNYHYACPDTKIALIGYSSGAIIIMNTICGGLVSTSLAGSTIIGTVLYGDETRVGGQSYDTGTCTDYNAISPRADPSCDPWSSHMQSYCDLTDPECCTGSGDNVAIHLSYDNTYDAVATQFIVNTFNAAGGA